MKIKYLGTAACEGVPAAFCRCEVCEKSRKAGGRNIRTRSQALVDDTLLLDLNADTYVHSLFYGLDLPSIHTCLITHDHEDHLYQDELLNRQEGFALVSTESRFLSMERIRPMRRWLRPSTRGRAMRIIT